jgi:hypothetical protein
VDRLSEGVVDYMENNISDMNEKLGVPVNLASCHTGVVSGKFVEGHVPVTQIAELSRRANLDGIAAFGMPVGSLGMESGDRRSAYPVIGMSKSRGETVLQDFRAR